MISIVIPFCRGITYLKDCLATLRQTVPYEIVLVKNTADDLDLTELARLHNVRLLDLGGPVGYSTAINRGVGSTDTSLVCFCDADTAVSGDWATPHLAAHARFPDLGATSSLLINPRTGWITDCGIAFFEHGHFHPFLDTNAGMVRGSEPLEFPGVCSALMVIKREAFLQVGGFDTAYHHYFQDVDLCLRLRAAQWRCAIVPDSRGYHHSRSAGVNTPAGRLDMTAFHFARHRDGRPSNIPDFLERMLDAFVRRHTLGVDYHWIDLSSLSAPKEFRDAFARRLRLSNITARRSEQRDADAINLFECADYRALVTDLPTILFVDRFRSLEPNAYWRLRRRGRGDLVVDRHGCILRLDDLGTQDAVAWPYGAKGSS